MVFLRYVGRGYRVRAPNKHCAFGACARGGVAQARVVSAFNLGAQMVDLMDEELMLHADQQQREANREEGADHDAARE